MKKNNKNGQMLFMFHALITAGRCSMSKSSKCETNCLAFCWEWGFYVLTQSSDIFWIGQPFLNCIFSIAIIDRMMNQFRPNRMDNFTMSSTHISHYYLCIAQMSDKEESETDEESDQTSFHNIKMNCIIWPLIPLLLQLHIPIHF